MAKRQRPTIKAKINEDKSTEQEKIVQKLQEEKKKEKKTSPKKTRFTMDLSPELYTAIKEHIKETGQTMKGYFISLAKKDLRNSKE